MLTDRDKSVNHLMSVEIFSWLTAHVLNLFWRWGQVKRRVTKSSTSHWAPQSGVKLSERWVCGRHLTGEPQSSRVLPGALDGSSTFGQPQPANRDPGRKEKVPLMTTSQRISSNSTIDSAEKYFLTERHPVTVSVWFRLWALDGAFNQWLSTHACKAYTRTALWQKYCCKIFSESKTNEETNDPLLALTWLFFFFC